MVRLTCFFWTLFALFFFSSCRNQSDGEGKNQNLMQVKVVKAKKTNISISVNTSGLLFNKHEIKLSFKTGGVIRDIVVNEGQIVSQGQVLAKLHLDEIDAHVAQARVAVDKAQRDLERAGNLFADSVATLEQLQNAQAALDYANSQLQIAEFNRQYSVIRAPYDGKVLKKLAEKNEIIAAGHPLFLFASGKSDWVLRTALADVDAVRIKPGNEARVSFDAFPGKYYDAVVSEIANMADRYTGTYEAGLKIIGKEPRFVSGLVGKAIIYPPAEEDLYSLPPGVAHEADEMQVWVYVVKGDTYDRKKLRLIHLTDSLIYFREGISETDSVIIEGAEYLRSGSKVKIINN